MEAFVTISTHRISLDKLLKALKLKVKGEVTSFCVPAKQKGKSINEKHLLLEFKHNGKGTA